ncbi:MAG: sigma-70 family RNA polymerase sigma factor [Peptostreptococcaceae bacterium]
MKKSKMGAPEEDIILVDNVLKGDVDSFELIVGKYQLNILQFVYGMLKQKEASEDITQEVFITVYNKLDMYNNKYSFSNWILQIAKNKTIDYVRKYRKVFESDIDEVYDISSSQMGPEESLEYLEVKVKIKEYIDTLGEVDRQILALRYTQNLTFRDIGQILEVTETTVKRRYYKIRDGFKDFSK